MQPASAPSQRTEWNDNYCYDDDDDAAAPVLVAFAAAGRPHLRSVRIGTRDRFIDDVKDDDM